MVRPDRFVAAHAGTVDELPLRSRVDSGGRTTVTWTATATGTVQPLEYRFERRDDLGNWSIVQNYGMANSYTWTPAVADVGTNAVRVSVRNGGSLADFEDTATLLVAGWGRYTQSDPIGLAGGMNVYSYAFWNPVRYIETKSFPAWWQCNDACKAYYKNIYEDFASNWVHENNPHP